MKTLEGYSYSSETSDENNEDNDQVPIVAKNYRSSLIGRIRTLGNVGAIEWCFLTLSLVSILVGFGFTLYRMSRLRPDCHDQFVFAILVMINLGFATWYMAHSVFQEQPYEILMYIFTTILLGGLVTVNFASGEPERNRIRLIRFIVTIVLSVPNVVIGAKLGWKYWSSGSLIFKTVGADMTLQKMCRTYFLGLSLLVFDAQVGISCIILVMQNGFTGMTNEEIVILVTGAVFSALWLVIGYAGMRMENLRITCLFAVISIIQPLYVLFLFVTGLDQFEKPYSLRTELAFLSGIILLLAHFTLLSTVPIIASNFGKGLTVAIYGNESSSTPSRPSGSGLTSIEDEEPLIEPSSSQSQNYDAITVVRTPALH